jgi:GNAT superfamily N-acetyltransferase
VVTLRPVGPGDEPFLYRVYASTREAELALTGWDGEQQQAFLRQQFGAQQAYYRQHYQDPAFQVVLCDGVPAGRLYVARWADEIRIVDIALLPPWRNAGIGTALLRGLLAEGAGAGKRVSIHVERFNPALRLYARLGFRQVEDKGVYLLLEWTPGAPEPSRAPGGRGGESGQAKTAS